MRQKNLFQDEPEQLRLPAIEIKPISLRIGQIRHVLVPEQMVTVDARGTIPITKRISETLLELSNGEKIVLTGRVKLERPAGADGVLRKLDMGGLQWLNHKRIDDFDASLAKIGWAGVKADITNAWNGKFRFKREVQEPDGSVKPENKGLRPPQIGALHAIGAHWSLSHSPATIVMPTGTGKTETMLSALVSYFRETMLVTVPYDILRSQTARKFLTLGLLRELGTIDASVPNPIVGIVTRRPHSEEELEFFSRCHVVIGTMSSLGEGPAVQLAPAMAKKVEGLVVDEAHHIAADGWTRFRQAFAGTKTLQFTATPFRRDGKHVDGLVIYNYPLKQAQRDNYFKKITFEPVYDLDRDKGDALVADSAIRAVRVDVAKGLNHIVMARCGSIDRAEKLLDVYKRKAADLNPVIIHSELADADDRIAALRTGGHRIVVCVGMLGEGFDLPQLKIAAVHDKHKSLAPLLQFTGRFTRTAGDKIGDATVVANIADPDVPAALERLYSEDADWNQLLSEMSSDAAKQHAELVDFLANSKRLDEMIEEEDIAISHQLLKPTLGTLVFKADRFEPKRFHEGLPDEHELQQVWLNEKKRTLFFVTKTDTPLKWTRSKEVLDRAWSLFVLHYDEDRGLLYLASSDHSATFTEMAKGVGATELISGETIFRCLGRINRLIFQSVGVKKHGRRNLRYAMYTGADVAEALSVSERAGSVKSNLSGTGWENGNPISIGCSYKGRIWSRERGPIPKFVEWCQNVGSKIIDDTINPANIIANVLIPEEVTSLPDKQVLSIEWPIEVWSKPDENVDISQGTHEQPLSMFEISYVGSDFITSSLQFAVTSADGVIKAIFSLIVGGDDGFAVRQIVGDPMSISFGRSKVELAVQLSSYPPLIRFVDLTELDGNLLIKPQNVQELALPEECFEPWDWAGTDITLESIWKDGALRQHSIQERAAKHFIDGGFEVVFDDDDAGEAADLVCMKEEKDYIRLALVHCKFSGGDEPGRRVKDVVEVCSQAVRSAKWKWKFKNLCQHILGREKRLTNAARPTRFMTGQATDINRIMKVSRFKEVQVEILVVQPGLSQAKITADQSVVLAAAASYLKETVGVDLDILCSA